jgi:hypothetical protein
MMRTPYGHAGRAGISIAGLDRTNAFKLSAILLPTNSSFDDRETMSTFHGTSNQGWCTTASRGGRGRLIEYSPA